MNCTCESARNKLASMSISPELRRTNELKLSNALGEELCPTLTPEEVSDSVSWIYDTYLGVERSDKQEAKFRFEVGKLDTITPKKLLSIGAKICPKNG